MHALRIVVSILLIESLMIVVVFHAISGTHRFSINWNPPAEIGGIEEQRYIQSIPPPGTVLIAIRGQPRISPTKLSLFSITVDRQIRHPRGLTRGDEGLTRSYMLGVSYDSHDRPDQRFFARYLYLRLWLVELLILLAIAGIWIPWFVNFYKERKPVHDAGQT